MRDAFFPTMVAASAGNEMFEFLIYFMGLDSHVRLFALFLLCNNDFVGGSCRRISPCSTQCHFCPPPLSLPMTTTAVPCPRNESP